MVGKIKEWNKEIMSKEKLQKLWRTMDGFVSYCRNTNLSFILPYYSREEKLQPCLPLTFEALPSVLEHLCPHFSFLFWQSFPPCDNAWSKRQRRVPQHEEQMARPSRDGFSEGKKTFTLRLTHWDPADPGTQSPSQRDSSVFLGPTLLLLPSSNRLKLIKLCEFVLQGGTKCMTVLQRKRSSLPILITKQDGYLLWINYTCIKARKHV